LLPPASYSKKILLFVVLIPRTTKQKQKSGNANNAFFLFLDKGSYQQEGAQMERGAWLFWMLILPSLITIRHTKKRAGKLFDWSV